MEDPQKLSIFLFHGFAQKRVKFGDEYIIRQGKDEGATVMRGCDILSGNWGKPKPFVDIKTTKILHINFMNLVKMKSAKILWKPKFLKIRDLGMAWFWDVWIL